MDINKLNEDVEKAFQIGFSQNAVSMLLVFSQSSKDDEFARIVLHLCNYLLNEMSSIFGMEIIISFINDMFEDSDKLDNMGFRMYHLATSKKLGMFDEVIAAKEDIFNMLFVYKTKLVAPAFFTEIANIIYDFDDEEAEE